MVPKPTSAPRARAPGDSERLARACASVADDRKGEDIVILDLRRHTYVCDFFVIVTAANPRQMDAIVESIRRELRKGGQRPLGAEGAKGSRWALLDYGDVVVHVFEPEWRKLYDLELLWGDAPRLPWGEGRTGP
jgi:ribosome-associated protein